VSVLGSSTLAIVDPLSVRVLSVYCQTATFNKGYPELIADLF